MVDNNLYALHENNYEESANRAMSQNGYNCHDHYDDNVIGCPINEGVFLFNL